jgi:hypothetical protein
MAYAHPFGEALAAFVLRRGVWAARDAGVQGQLGRFPVRAAEGPVASARHEHVVGAVHQPVQGAFGQDGWARTRGCRSRRR